MKQECSNCSTGPRGVEPNRSLVRTTRAVRDDEPPNRDSPRADDPARLRAQAERRFVLRCSGCNLEIAKSRASEAGWRFLPIGSTESRPYCPDCAAKRQSVVATCDSCGTQIAASAAADFGWRSWPDESGAEQLLCAACGANRVDAG